MRDCLGCGYAGKAAAYDRKQGTLISTSPMRSRAASARPPLRRRSASVRATRRIAAAESERAGRVRATKTGSRPNTVVAGRSSFARSLFSSAAAPSRHPRSFNVPAIRSRGGRRPRPRPSPAVPIAGLMDRQLTNYRGNLRNDYSDQFFESHGLYFECLFGHPCMGRSCSRRSDPSIRVDAPISTAGGFRRASRRLASIPPIPLRWDATANLARTLPARRRPIGSACASESQRRPEVMFAAGAREVIVASEEPVRPPAMPGSATRPKQVLRGSSVHLAADDGDVVALSGHRKREEGSLAMR